MSKNITAASHSVEMAENSFQTIPPAVTRRAFLGAVAAIPLSMAFSLPSFAKGKKITKTCLPILLFHRVVDFPQYREQMTPDDLQEFFTFLWENDFFPVTFTDILKNKISGLVPAGKKPVCITTDDSHPSIFFNRTVSSKIPCERSFMEVFLSTLQTYNLPPRATFFLEGVKCFGGILSMPEILDKLEKEAPGIECGYHTMYHRRMDIMSKERARQAITMQMDGFHSMGIENRIAKVFAYPYGRKPSFDMQGIFEELGFYGAFHSFHVCPYDGELQVSPFLVPRQPVCPFAYQRDKSLPRRRISPVKQFKNEVMNASFQPYIVPNPKEKS